VTPPTRYRDAGVDIDAGEEAVRRIRKTVASTFGPHVVTDIGSFAGVTMIPGADPDNLLVASMDGVGTKLKVAIQMERYDTVGEDLVNHCVGDIGVHGAEPLFFLDYLGMGKLDPGVVESVVQGLARGCRANDCALLGGETAEMPGVYQPADFDLVGCIVGTVARADLVDGSELSPGDILLGFASTGLQTNGYSLARRILFEDSGLSPADNLPGTDGSLGEALLAVHRSYLPVLRALRGTMKGAAHITGGGIPGNLSRVLPPGTAARVDRSVWSVPSIFGFLAQTGDVPEDDLYRTFNMGIGLVVGVSVERVEECLDRVGEGFVIGEIVAGDGDVTLEGEPGW
jgi:phosphoribosylformylglycinamidine cyclo-ligase